MIRANKIGVLDSLIEASTKKGAIIRIVCPLAEENSEIVTRISKRAPDIRILNYDNNASSQSGLLVVDRAKFMRFELKEPKAEEFSDAIGFVIFSNNKASVESSKSFFELLWNERIQQEKLKEYEKLKEADKMKTEFINIAAHELRTPIQPILGLSEVLQSKITDNEQRLLVDIISRNAKRLQRLTEDILDVTRIESQSLRLKKEKFILNDLVSSIIEEYKNEITDDNKSNIQLFYNPIEYYNIIIVYADRHRITQVTSNLMDNAIKFTKEEGGGTVSINIKKRESESSVIVSIKDTGSGIDPEIMPRLFTKFTSKSFKGTGLGLFISKSIIEAHGGRIWAENNSNGKGATFSFSLPIFKT